MSEEMEKAAIIKRGRNAERHINGARIAASTAWSAWRNYGTFKTPEGHVTSTVLMPTVRMQKPNSAPAGQPGIMIEVQTDTEHPEHKRLRELAEEADARVLEFEDDLEMYAAVAPQMGRRR
jgi:hypothetical protein